MFYGKMATAARLQKRYSPEFRTIFRKGFSVVFILYDSPIVVNKKIQIKARGDEPDDGRPSIDEIF